MRELPILIDLFHEMYPEYDILCEQEEWLSTNFEPPCIFLQTEVVTEQLYSSTSYIAIVDAGIVLHHPKEEGVYQPITTEPLRRYLRKEKYSYRSSSSGLFINIDSDSFDIRTDKKDRTEITFRFEYIGSLDKDKQEKIQEFNIEEV
ncbi:hypothetical protein [Brevibacillus halotolerans]|uniref:hypothetical protein n=1 Tax=Brevibacillus halotolerans TaxID=1507437 RepID=UPI0015EEEFC7|nr:hypothetical protein [Brevibacillus halotolerans]MBA4534416.1 hypothetical protein [Brevibacillus halotolerans]